LSRSSSASNRRKSAASLTWEYIKKTQGIKGENIDYKKQAIERMVKVVVEIDHFKEVFWENPTADYYDFSLLD